MPPCKGNAMKTLLLIAMLALAPIVMTPVAQAQTHVSVSVLIAPPPLPIYVQPPIPGDDYIWTPGYWAWDPADNDYYWVPGTWVLAPFVAPCGRRGIGAGSAAPLCGVPAIGARTSAITAAST